ncbi:MAG TPA: type 1 glutamine amidotransferase [Thermodesulfovibrionales bacterium]|nr:type 1 glutamine amidotransferase [Thermodesulfovibrionales bacterium]
MAVLIIKNIITEGPGTIEDFLRKEDFSFKVVELSSGEVPPSLEDFNSLVIMGGPMGVYEIGQYPHLRIESRIIREAINRDMKVLGICLGAQMIAYCLGSDVYKGPKEEIGWQHIELTGDGIKDLFMRKLAIHPSVGDFWRKFKVFHWHGDTFEIPIGAVLLASSELYKNQAFRYKNNVYGFQFHIEVTKKMITDWFENRPEADSIVKETDGIYEEYSGRARNFYKAFF